MMILSPTGCACRMDVYVVGYDANAGSVDENLVCLAAVNHLRITSDKLHSGGIGRSVHRLDDAPEIFHRHTFFQDKAGREIKRTRAAHREIVHRSVNSEFSDIAAGKKDRTYDERIGAKCDALPFNEKMAPSCSGSSSSLPKLRQHHFLNELVAELAAAAVGENNLFVVRDRQRTGSA